ncbi:MAG: hypothetical protein SGILL_007621 [Bacillariaceae sp.]
MGKKSRRVRQGRQPPRVKADLALQKFQSLPLTVQDPWNQARISAFCAYATMFTKECLEEVADVIKNPSNRFYREDDLQVLSNVAASENEPAVCRVLALDLLGKFGALTMDEFGESLERFEDALGLCKSTGSTDRQRNIVLRNQTVNVGAWLKGQEKSLEDFVSGESEMLFGSKYAIRGWSPNGYDVDCGSLAGLCCDYCGKSREGELLMCSKCRMAHYCNSDCQLKAWLEHGHQKVCRKPGVFKVGDHAVTFEPFGERTKFGGHVKIIEACPMAGSSSTRPSHWVVESTLADYQLAGGSNDIATVPSERLRLLRQPLWNKITKDDLQQIIMPILRERDRLAEQDQNDDEENDNHLPDLTDKRAHHIRKGWSIDRKGR